MKNLKERAIRGGVVRACAQVATFLLRIGSLYVLARLLEPNDFGLVGMATSIIGVLHLFKEFGLSTAAIQRATVTEEQLATLFWINILAGVILAATCLITAPAIAAFYHEQRLVWVTVALACGFLFNALGVQHSAILQRDMRFSVLALIDILALLVSTALGVVLAVQNYGYWSLVGMTVTAPLVSSIGLWIATGWIPGPPRRGVEVRSMLRFGGTTTLNALLVYVAYNLDKVLIGRVWGADAIGLYGRAYQLVSLPTDNLNAAIGGLAFSALARLQHDARRLSHYFLQGYSLVLAMTIPVTVFSTIFAPGIILVVMGPRWMDVVPIFRLLAPAIVVFAIINPLGWLMVSLGLIHRSLKVALVISPLVVLGYVLGLPYGPAGMAFGFSAALTLWLVPHILWCVRGTAVSLWDVLIVVSRTVLSSVVASFGAYGVHLFYSKSVLPIPGLAVDGLVFSIIYMVMLLEAMGQKHLFLNVMRGLKRSPAVEEPVLVA